MIDSEPPNDLTCEVVVEPEFKLSDLFVSNESTVSVDVLYSETLTPTEAVASGPSAIP